MPNKSFLFYIRVFLIASTYRAFDRSSFWRLQMQFSPARITCCIEHLRFFFFYDRKYAPNRKKKWKYRAAQHQLWVLHIVFLVYKSGEKKVGSFLSPAHTLHKTPFVSLLLFYIYENNRILYIAYRPVRLTRKFNWSVTLYKKKKRNNSRMNEGTHSNELVVISKQENQHLFSIIYRNQKIEKMGGTAFDFIDAINPLRNEQFNAHLKCIWMSHFVNIKVTFHWTNKESWPRALFVYILRHSKENFKCYNGIHRLFVRQVYNKNRYIQTCVNI